MEDQRREPFLLAEYGFLGDLSLRNVFEHRDREFRLALLVALEGRRHLNPDQAAVLAIAALLQLIAVALARHQFLQQSEVALDVVGVCVATQVRLGQLRGAVAEHLHNRRVRFDHAAVCLDSQDPDRSALENRAIAAERLELGTLGL